MKYDRFDYEKAIEHWRNIIFVSRRISVAPEGKKKTDYLNKFVEWFVMALNDGCDIESDIILHSGKKKADRYTEIRLGDFFVNDSKLNLQKEEYEIDEINKVILLVNFLVENIRLWCNLKKMDPNLFISCFKPKNIYEFMRLISTEDEDCEFDKAIFAGVDRSASPVSFYSFLRYENAVYKLFMPILELDIKYSEDTPEWFSFAIKTINDRAAHLIEDSFVNESEINTVT